MRKTKIKVGNDIFIIFNIHLQYTHCYIFITTKWDSHIKYFCLLYHYWYLDYENNCIDDA